MRKIIIKIPKEKNAKWSLQMKGIAARRFVSAASLFNRLERVFPGKEFKEKTEIAMKEYIDGHWENTNETLASKSPEYLLFTLACLMEDDLKKSVLSSKYKKYGKNSEDY